MEEKTHKCKGCSKEIPKSKERCKNCDSELNRISDKIIKNTGVSIPKL